MTSRILCLVASSNGPSPVKNSITNDTMLINVNLNDIDITKTTIQQTGILSPTTADTKSTNKQTENKITKQEQQAMEGIMGSMQLYSTLKKNNEDKISKLRSVIVISS